MSNDINTTEGPMSLSAIAATMGPDPVPTPAPASEEMAHPTDGTPEASELDAQPVDDTPPPSEEPNADGQDLPAADDEEEDDLEFEGDDGETVYQVPIGKDVEEVSIDKLVRSYALNKLADQRLQEATEIRKSAEEEGRKAAFEEHNAELTSQLEAVQNERRQLAALFQSTASEILAPRVEKPSKEMRATDPIGYFDQVEAYREDQERLQRKQMELGRLQHDVTAQDEGTRALVAKREIEKLYAAQPALREEQHRKAFQSRTMSVAQHVGFTEAEVASVLDHRVHILADMAGKWMAHEAALKAGAKPPGQKVIEKGKKVLKPAARVKVRTADQKQRRAAVERARKTGDPMDIAKTM